MPEVMFISWQRFSNANFTQLIIITVWKWFLRVVCYFRFEDERLKTEKFRKKMHVILML